ncbi:MAG: hypothetical protein WBA37_12155 [Xanthobacteraceae bacterium]|jgi:hypothetical protein
MEADMNKWIATTALLLMVAAPEAIAQTGRSGASPTMPGVSTPVPSAPVGHRQPRRGDVPSEKNIDNPNDPIAREDAQLDRKLKSICRGC